MISQGRLKIEVKLLLSANRKSYIPRRLAQQRVTLSDREWPFHASRAISAAAQLFVIIIIVVVAAAGVIMRRCQIDRPGRCCSRACEFQL